VSDEVYVNQRMRRNCPQLGQRFDPYKTNFDPKSINREKTPEAAEKNLMCL